MADVTVKRLEEFEAIFGGGFRRVRAGLGVSSFGLAVMDLPPGFDHYPEHDHGPDGQEEVYTVLVGTATLDRRRRGARARAGGVRARRPAGEAKIITGDEGARLLAHRRLAREGLRAPRVHRGGPARPDGAVGRARSVAEQVLVRGALERRGARAVVGADEAPQPPHHAPPGRPASLSRARSAAAATWSATATAVAASSRPCGPAPAPVVERRQSRAADRDVGLTEPPRPPEAVGDHHRRPRRPRPRRSRARIRRADASGSSGSRATRSAPGRSRRRCPRSRRSSRSGSRRSERRARRGRSRGSRRGSARPGAGPCRARAASSRARSARLHVGQLAHPPLGLRNDLLGDDHDVAVRRLHARAREPLRRSARRGGRRRRSPAARRSGPPRAVAHAGATPLSRPSRASSAAVAGLGAALAPAPSASAARSAGVSTSRPSESSGSTATSCPARRARSAWRARAAGPEGGADRVGRREQERVGPGPVAVGHDRHPAAPHAGRAPRRARAGSSSGQSPGSRADALGAERLRADDPRASPPPSGRRRGGRAEPRAVRSPCSAPRARSARPAARR